MRSQAQPIILAAGSGSKMTSLVKKLPKCLLPIANRPMIFYPLYMLHQAGFTEATVVVNAKTESEVKKAIDQLNLDIKAEYLSIDVSDDPGTADSLRLIANKIKKNVEDVILISSDLISNLSLQEMIGKHIAVGAMMTILTTKLDKSKVIVPGPKMKSNIEHDLLFIEDETNYIKFMVAAGDYEDSLSLSLTNQAAFENPLKLLTASDSHLFILRRWVFDYILYKDSPCSSMISIKSEVIPHIIECRVTRRIGSQKKILDDFIKKGAVEDLVSTFNTSRLPGRYNVKPDKKICLTFFHENCTRINKLTTFWMINRMMTDSEEEITKFGIERRQHATANIHEKAQVCSKSFIGKKAVISEKTNIKSSAVGNSCRIHSLVRVSNSVLFDQVDIISGVVIEESIICTPINIKCTIKNCIVIDNYSLKENHAYQNEIIESSQVFA